MQPNHPTPDNAGPGRQPAPAAPAVTSAAPSPSDHLHLRGVPRGFRGTWRRQAAGPAMSGCGFSGTGSA
jgi:hypothetical protein